MNFESNFLDNRTEAIKLRKHENNLVIAGMGVMIFGLWNVAKFFSILFLNKNLLIGEIQNEVAQTTETANVQVSGNFVFGLLLLASAAMMSVNVFFRLFIGFSAISVGKNGRKRFLYIPLAIIYAIICLLDSVVEFYSNFIFSYDGPDALQITESPTVSIIIEITSTILFIELIVHSIRIRKLRNTHGINKESLAQITEENLADVDTVTKELGQHLHITK